LLEGNGDADKDFSRDECVDVFGGRSHNAADQGDARADNEEPASTDD
jgi:hypothetical protein